MGVSTVTLAEEAAQCVKRGFSECISWVASKWRRHSGYRVIWVSRVGEGRGRSTVCKIA